MFDPHLRASTRAAELWRGLTAGQWSVVRNTQYEAQRVVLVRRGPTRDVRRLSARERAVLRCAVRGWTNQAIATDVGVAPSTVSAHLSTTLRKLGFGSRTELVTVHQHLQHLDAPCERWRVGEDDLGSFSVAVDPPRWPSDLGATERQLARLLVRGLSITAIADARGTAETTVSNQLHAMYRRWDVHGRTPFVVALLDRAYRN